MDLSLIFSPREIYLSEWCRFLAGIMPAGKSAEIVPQGFSHPTFLRPLGRDDGYWSAMVPVAAGIDWVVPYTYPLQRMSPVLETYERCFEFDRYFEECSPLKYAALAHGFHTEVQRYPQPSMATDSYVGTRILPCADSLRHRGLAYTYLPDRRILPDELRQYRVLVLPDISCLNPEQALAIKRYWEEGGGIVASGEVGLHDFVGNPNDSRILADMFGIEISGEPGDQEEFEIIESHPALGDLKDYAADFKGYFGGTMNPIFSLGKTRSVRSIGESDIPARFADGRPAIVLPKEKEGRGRLVYFAGFPSIRCPNRKYRTTVTNRANKLFAAAVEWAAKGKPALYPGDWSEQVPMAPYRLLSPRFMPTYEFFPLEGENLYIAVITSYFKEPVSFPLFAEMKTGRRLKNVRELISGESFPWAEEENRYSLQVSFGFDDPIKIYLFEF